MNLSVHLGWLTAMMFAACSAPPSPVAVVPLRPVEPAPPAPPPAAAGGIYRPPRIGKVFLRAHVDASGRLFGPQVVYQIVEPGGWNLDALEPADPEPRKVRTSATTPVFEADAGWLISGSDEAVASTGSSRPSSGTAPKQDP